MALLRYTVDFLTETGTIIASRIGQNFADVANLLNGQLTNVNLAASAGIVRSQLRDRYVGVPNQFPLVPYTSGADLAAPANFNNYDAMTRLVRRRIKARSGDRHELCGVEIIADNIAAAASPWPRIQVYKNGVAVNGAIFDIQADNEYYTWERADMWSTPLLSFIHNDEIEYRIGSETGAGSPDLRGVTVTEYWKVPLIQ